MSIETIVFNSGDLISSDDLQKLNNNDEQLFQAYYEAGRGLLAMKHMVPTDTANDRTTVTGNTLVTLISMDVKVYPDKYYLLESRISRTQNITGQFQYFYFTVDGTQKLKYRQPNNESSTSDPNCFAGMTICLVWQSPSDIAATGEYINFQLQSNTNTGASYYVYSDLAGLVGGTFLYLTDIGRVGRSSILKQ
jgi:hypothetical protein